MEKFIVLNLTKEELTSLIQSAVENSMSGKQNRKQEDQLIKINRLCEILKVSKATIHKWKKEGLIPFKRISNRVFFDIEAVLASLSNVQLKGGKRLQ